MLLLLLLLLLQLLLQQLRLRLPCCMQPQIAVVCMQRQRMCMIIRLSYSVFQEYMHLWICFSF